MRFFEVIHLTPSFCDNHGCKLTVSKNAHILDLRLWNQNKTYLLLGFYWFNGLFLEFPHFCWYWTVKKGTFHPPIDPISPRPPDIFFFWQLILVYKWVFLLVRLGRFATLFCWYWQNKSPNPVWLFTTRKI